MREERLNAVVSLGRVYYVSFLISAYISKYQKFRIFNNSI